MPNKTINYLNPGISGINEVSKYVRDVAANVAVPSGTVVATVVGIEYDPNRTANIIKKL